MEDFFPDDVSWSRHESATYSMRKNDQMFLISAVKYFDYSISKESKMLRIGESDIR
jgi:hypothetical protein